MKLAHKRWFAPAVEVDDGTESASASFVAVFINVCQIPGCRITKI